MKSARQHQRMIIDLLCHFAGIIAMFIGLVRLGILVDFIPGKVQKKNSMIQISFFVNLNLTT